MTAKEGDEAMTEPAEPPVVAPRDGDVYRFNYSAASRDNSRRFDLDWCFDGQLVYRDGQLCDTYWGLTRHGVDGRSFTVAEAAAKGTLVYVCNLNEVEKIREDEYPLYAEGDAFNLSHQHGCYKHYVRRHGAKKDKALMVAALHRKVQDAIAEIDNAVQHLEWAIRQREQLTPRIAAGEEPCP